MRYLGFALALLLSGNASAAPAAPEMGQLQAASGLAADLRLDSPEQASSSGLEIQRALAGEAGAIRPRSMAAKGLPDVGGELHRIGETIGAKADRLRRKVFVPAPHGVDREDSWAAKVAPAGRWIGVAVGWAALIGAITGAVTLPLYFAIPATAFVLFGARPGMATVQRASENVLAKTAGFAGKLWDRMAR